MDSVLTRSDNFIMNTYKRFKIFFSYGKGVYLYDYYGKRYLDFLAGIAVNILGHSHPVMVDAVKEQVGKLIHVSNLYYIKEQTDLAQLLVENSCCDKVFFCNSGAEANEAAIKLARIWGNPGRNKILSMKNSFHGRTLAALAATGQVKYHRGFEPIPEGFDYIVFNDFSNFLEKVDDSVVGIMVEFIQGEGGINVADRNFIFELYKYCKDNKILFIADEIQTGMGRTGKLFAYEHYGIEPDIITMAKGLGGGLPIGAVLAKEFVAEKFTYGSHGSTFGGNPLVSYVSKRILEFTIKSGLVGHVSETGDYLLAKLRKLMMEKEYIESVDGIGLMVGIHFTKAEFVEKLIKKGLDEGILFGKAGEKTLRLEPPLIIEKSHVDEVVDFLQRNL